MKAKTPATRPQGRIHRLHRRPKRHLRVELGAPRPSRRVKPSATPWADRLYSNWPLGRWGQQLHARKIRQHLGITKNDRRFCDNYEHLTAGSLRCRATPRGLGTIHKPAPNDLEPRWDEFSDRIEIRRPWSFDRIAGPDIAGNQRWG